MASMKTRAAVAALALIATGMLSACGGNPIDKAVDKAVGDAVENGVEQAVENAAGEDVDIDVNLDGGSVDLPGGFPSGIPLPEDAKLVSTFSADGAWNLSYEIDDFGTGPQLADTYKSDSTWTLVQESLSDGFGTWLFTNDQYQVVILAAGDGSTENVLSLTVSPLTQ
jgi:hypothetical protein